MGTTSPTFIFVMELAELLARPWSVVRDALRVSRGCQDRGSLTVQVPRPPTDPSELVLAWRPLTIVLPAA